MSETSSSMESSTGETESAPESAEAAPKTNDASTDSMAMELGEALGESPLALTAQEHETAREVAARHFARLMYAPQSTWSRYVFHENDPHPFGARRERGES